MQRQSEFLTANNLASFNLALFNLASFNNAGGFTQRWRACPEEKVLWVHQRSFVFLLPLRSPGLIRSCPCHVALSWHRTHRQLQYWTSSRGSIKRPKQQNGSTSRLSKTWPMRC